MLIANCRQLAACHRVSDEDRSGDPQCPQHLDDVVGETLVVVAGWRMIRCSVAATRDPIHFAAGPQLGSEIVIDVRRIAGPSQQDHWTARASPFEHFETDIFLDLDERDFVR